MLNQTGCEEVSSLEGCAAGVFVVSGSDSA